MAKPVFSLLWKQKPMIHILDEKKEGFKYTLLPEAKRLVSTRYISIHWTMKSQFIGIRLMFHQSLLLLQLYKISTDLLQKNNTGQSVTMAIFLG
jgi:hypothetical protein